ncbi:BglII/BstYI family type II restriction endonuclease [Pseudomonas protegens]|uniref:BglII/BstYI family type II restriction endonuclease n=1 Tax=Pseudomonas protegens TaxID=380021 RepID=UPI001B3011A3|nr:BglII/BstYI family type II restriction endonuclease [Pseudomonas protegens]MBP5097637.1 hypothetical protein [Pseudomonas protegens]QTU04867.1 hypothetical protein HUT25_03575 [Pseudomonas protegens]QTU11177.1 hypothetical protein HUT23_04265 [Pseudomonas protegens]QTU41445.1 hypothetical protein HUT24_28035 [Pseudomonas protegens]
MKHALHSHCGGESVLPMALQKEIEAAIAAITVKPEVGAAAKIRDAFLLSLKASGWSSEVSVSRDSDMTITSLKNGVGLCLQTGNVARIYADLIKLQAMYLDNSIRSAAIILPSHPLAKQLGSNIAQAKRLERELGIFKKAYHVPTLVFSLE